MGVAELESTVTPLDSIPPKSQTLELSNEVLYNSVPQGVVDLQAVKV